jgi:bisphosphoglycerate-independent phosphoglycerate mutase (AlkP superfamily)
VYQELQRINVTIREGLLARNQSLKAALEFAKAMSKPLHLWVLLAMEGYISYQSLEGTS